MGDIVVCHTTVIIFKDMFSAVRDVVGGRAGAVQDTLRDLRGQALEQLRQEDPEWAQMLSLALTWIIQNLANTGRSMLFTSQTARL